MDAWSGGCDEMNGEVPCEKSALREWNALPVVVEDVFDINRIRADADDFVTPVHDVAFGGDEHVFALREEDSLRLTGLAGKAEELEHDGRGWRRGLGNEGFWGILFIPVRSAGFYRLWNICARYEDIASIAAVLGLLGGCQEC